MTYRILVEAGSEIDIAQVWYERQKPGLGDDFVAEIFEAVRRILQFPHSFARMDYTARNREIRFLNVDRFDYLIVYEVLPLEVVILGVPHSHSSRRPWRNRLT